MYLSPAFYQSTMPSSPFSKISRSQEKKFTYGLLFLLVVVIAILKYFDHFLINEVCEGGIISFELSKELETAVAYMDSWGDIGRNAAGLSLGLDFLFPALYSTFIALLIHKLNQRLYVGTKFYAVGIFIIWLQFVAAIFDLIENYGLIRLLLGDLDQLWVSVSYYFAIMKFLLILIGIIYILVNFGVFLVKKRT